MAQSSENLLRLLASLCELLGAFLLSIEAMKLENFRRLRDRALMPLHRLINPTIEFVDDTETGALCRKTKLTNFICDPINLFFVVSVVFGAGALFVISSFFLPPEVGLLHLIAGLVPGPTVIDIVIGFPLFLLASLVCGLILYIVLVAIIQVSIIVLNLIDRHTPTGTIGILGFLLFLIGFIITN